MKLSYFSTSSPLCKPNKTFHLSFLRPKTVRRRLLIDYINFLENFPLLQDYLFFPKSLIIFAVTQLSRIFS